MSSITSHLNQKLPMKQPFIPLVLSLIAGITAGNFLEISNYLPLLMLSAVFLILVPAIRKNRKILIMFCSFLSLFLVGILNINLYLKPSLSLSHITYYADAEKITLEGIISDTPQIYPEKSTLIINASRVSVNNQYIPAEGKVLLSIKNNLKRFEYGDYIRVTTALKCPANFNNPGRFDYKKYLMYQRIHVRGSVKQPSDIIVIRKNQGAFFKTSIERFRSSLRLLIQGNEANLERKILQALILGEKSELPEVITEQFSRIGISHILAISGLHVGIIALFTFFFIKTIMKSSEYLLLRFNIIKTSTLLSVFPIIAYMFIAGSGISTIRATIMILAFLLALLLNRIKDPLNILAFAAFVILIFNPPSLFDVSFQLSFLSVASILIITPVMQSLLPAMFKGQKKTFFYRFLTSIIAFMIVTASAVLGTAPLIAFYFNRISTITLISNLMIIPLIGFVVLPLGIFCIITAPFSAVIASWFIKTASFFIGTALSIAQTLSSIPFSCLTVSTPTIFEIIFYYFLLLTIVVFVKKHKEGNKKRIAGTVLAVLLLLFVGNTLYVKVIKHHSNCLTATFLDVGHGNSAVISFPNGTIMLVDGGGFFDSSFDIGRYVVAPFLWREKIKHINIVVLTHPDRDHIGGLLYILKNFHIGEVWSNNDQIDDPLFSDFLHIIHEQALHHRIVGKDSPVITVGDATIQVIHPLQPLKSSQRNRLRTDANNNSVVLKITYGNVSMLLPGDILKAAEEEIVAQDNDLQSDILLAPHHGGKTSSTSAFIAAVNPRSVIISCGSKNIFRFPHPETLTRYERADAAIFRTDQNGAVTIKTDGRTFITSCFNGN